MTKNGYSHVPAVMKRFKKLLDEQAEAGLLSYGKPLTAWTSRDGVDDLQREVVDTMVYSVQLASEHRFMMILLSQLLFGELRQDDLSLILPREMIIRLGELMGERLPTDPHELI